MNSSCRSVLKLCCLLAAIAFCTFSCSGNPEKKKAAHFKKAMVYVEEKNPKAAIIELRNAIQIDPKYAQARYQLGLLYLNNGEIKGAFEEMQRAASLDPSNYDAKLKTAEFLLLTKNKSGAQKHAEEILAAQPDHVDALSLLANIFLAEGQHGEALKTIDKAIALQPAQDRLYLTKGRILIAQKKIQEAEIFFNKGLELNPGKAANYQILVTYYQTVGQKEKALQVAENMAKNLPDSSDAWLLRAALLRDNNNDQQAEEVFKEALSRFPKDSRLQAAVAEYYEQTGKFDQAEAVYKSAVTTAEKPEDAKSQLANFYFEQKKFDLAKMLMEEVLKQENNHKGALLVQDKFLIKNGQNQEAITSLTKLIRDFPQWAEAHFTKALAHINLGETELALSSLTEAVKFDPRNTKYHTTLSFLHLTSGRYDDAKKEAAIALKLQPKNLAAALLFAKGTVLAKDYATAVRILEEMQEKLPNHVEVIGNLGQAYLGQGDTEKAIKAFQRVLSLQPGNTAALVNLIRIKQQQGLSREELRQMVKEQLQTAPESPGHMMLMASMLVAEDQLDEALSYTQKVQQIQPQNPAAYALGADIYRRLNKTEQAINEYNKLLAADQKNIQAYMGLGALHEKNNNHDLAKKQYQEVLKINSTFAPAANNLAWLLTEEAQPDLGEALRLALTAKQTMPDDPNIIDTLGMVHYKRGSFNLARSEFSLAVEKRADLPVFQYHLALALYGDNQKDKAIETLREALAKDQPFAEKKEAEDTLAKWINNPDKK